MSSKSTTMRTRHETITGLSAFADIYRKEGRGALFSADRTDGTFSVTTNGNDKNPPVWISWRDREADMNMAGFTEVSEGVWKALKTA